MQDAVQGREDFERLNSIMNGLIEDNTKPGWLEENPHSIAAHVLKLTDQHGKPLNRARLIQVPLLGHTCKECRSHSRRLILLHFCLVMPMLRSAGC